MLSTVLALALMAIALSFAGFAVYRDRYAMRPLRAARDGEIRRRDEVKKSISSRPPTMAPEPRANA